jgi:hypothetical protein
MQLTAKNLTEAKETVRNLLEQLGLTAYLFEVEPHANQWQVRVECALNSGWQSSVLSIDDTALRACRTDRFVRDQMISELRKRLTAHGAG